MPEFDLTRWLKDGGGADYDLQREEKGKSDFYSLCRTIKEMFEKEWEESKDREELLEIQKRAIAGYENEISFFISKIRGVLNSLNVQYVDYPGWYTSSEEAIFHEVWGLAGMAEWFGEGYIGSSSAKIIGDRIFYMSSGRMKLMPQTISAERREQLLRALLLANPGERAGRDYYEVYMLDGTRVTIFKNNIVKSGEDIIIFRRYVVKSLTFEEQAYLGTIDRDMPELFRKMVEEGVSVAFVGEIRSGKSTFLATWQSYEDRQKEGVLIETDPEIPLHKIMPDAPIVQVIAEGEKMEGIVKSLMRSDAQYFIFGEARDAVTLNTALRVSERGGKRMKMTFHVTDPFAFPFAVAAEIVLKYGGSIADNALRAAKAFDYIFNFGEGRTSSEKRLLGIYRMHADDAQRTISIECICMYDRKTDRWVYEESLLPVKTYELGA